MNNNEPSGMPNYDEAEHRPRVNLSYANETLTADAKVRRTLRSRIAALFSFGQSNFVSAIKVSVAALIVFTYPVLTVAGHQLDDSAVELGDKRHWEVPEIGVVSTLIARELDGPGWLADKHAWHPQSRLTALPAWQTGLLSTMADHGRLMLDLMPEDRDQDLITAVRLLDTNETHRMTDRLLAATEAFTRYDDRVAGGVTRAPAGPDALITRLVTSAGWAEREYTKLAAIADPGDGWLASEAAIRSVYSSKAVAHVTLAMFEQVTDAEQALLRDLGLDAQAQSMLQKWRSAAQMRPLFVSNQGSNSLTGTNHPAAMALHMEQARRAALKFAQDLELALKERAETVPSTAPITVASGINKGN